MTAKQQGLLPLAAYLAGRFSSHSFSVNLLRFELNNLAASKAAEACTQAGDEKGARFWILGEE